MSKYVANLKDTELYFGVFKGSVSDKEIQKLNIGHFIKPIYV